MALRAWASLARLDKLKLIPRGACFSLPAGRQPGLGPRATKGDEARPAMFFNRVAAWPFGPPKGMKDRPVAKMRRTKWSVEAGFSTERRL
jgi:hypothetical protein